MKKILTIVFCVAVTAGLVYKLDYITNKLLDFLSATPKVYIANKNNYSKNKNYEFTKVTEDFVPYNYQDLINIFYTMLDSGYETFTFYCPSEYQTCIDDVEKLSNRDSSNILTTIGNFVSPFNNFQSMKVVYDTAGEVTIEAKHVYSNEDIEKVNKKIDEIWSSIVKSDMEKEDIIYAFHDYIINNTKYDDSYENEIKTGKTTHQSSKANGPLFEGYAICSGYTDLMAIILDRLEITNYKVASNNHVWNAVYINDKWLHLDLTWDDPVSQDRTKDNLLHKFYLIDTATLEEFDIEDHVFNKSIYLELK